MVPAEGLGALGGGRVGASWALGTAISRATAGKSRAALVECGHHLSEAGNLCLTSETAVEVAATVGGVATSTILSTMSASLARSVVSAEARTIRTLEGRRCRKSSFRKALSMVGPRWSPNSCCMRRSSCVGFLSPSSSPPSNCCSLRCSDAVVRLMSSAFSVS